LNEQRVIEKARQAPEMLGRNLVDEVTCGDPYEWSTEIEHQATTDYRRVLISDEITTLNPVTALHETGTIEPLLEDGSFHVVAYDFGIKYYILRYLAALGCRITVVPARTSADDVLSLAPDGIFLSNGPGDPAALPEIVSEVRKLVTAAPVFGICLGHQLLGRAFGGTTYKLKFGHRGGNQPVKNERTGRIEITSHNHGFAVDPDSLKASEIECTHFNLNDGTLEGLRHRSLPVFSVQYHPEAGPGPHDATYLFHEFLAQMREHRTNLHRIVQANS